MAFKHIKAALSKIFMLKKQNKTSLLTTYKSKLTVWAKSERFPRYWTSQAMTHTFQHSVLLMPQCTIPVPTYYILWNAGCHLFGLYLTWFIFVLCYYGALLMELSIKQNLRLPPLNDNKIPKKLVSLTIYILGKECPLLELKWYKI